MTYEYDTVDQFLLGDEVVSLPFITRVYRVDLELKWHEVYEGLLEHRVLDHYRDRSDAGPMSWQGFWRMLKWFGVHEAEDDPGSMVWYHTGWCVEAYDCGTGLRIFDNWSPLRQVKHFDRNFRVEIQSIPLCGSAAWLIRCHHSIFGFPPHPTFTNLYFNLEQTRHYSTNFDTLQTITFNSQLICSTIQTFSKLRIHSKAIKLTNIPV